MYYRERYHNELQEAYEEGYEAGKESILNEIGINLQGDLDIVKHLKQIVNVTRIMNRDFKRISKELGISAHILTLGPKELKQFEQAYSKSPKKKSRVNGIVSHALRYISDNVEREVSGQLKQS